MYRKGRFSVYVFLMYIENVVLRAFNVFRTTSVGDNLSPSDRKFRTVQIERSIFKLSEQDFDIDLSKENEDFICYMRTVQRAWNNMGREEALIERYEDKLTAQFYKMSSIIKDLKIENHNLKDEMIKMKGQAKEPNEEIDSGYQVNF